MKSTSSRIPWIDNARALGIVLVYEVHALEATFSRGDMNILVYYKFLTAFLLSFFFLMSGYSWRPARIEFIPFIKKMVISRFVPVAFFNFLGLFFLLFIAILTQEPDWERYLKGGLRLFTAGAPVYCFPMWFVVCLIVVEILHFWIARLIASNVGLVISIIFFTVFGWVVTENIGQITHFVGVKMDFWYLGEATIACSFFQIGILLKRLQWLSIPLPKKIDMLLFMIALAVTVGTFNLNQGPFKAILAFVAMALSSHGAIGWFYLTSLSGAAMLIYLAKLIPPNIHFEFVGKYTLGFVGLNGLFYHYINKAVIPLLLPESDAGIWSLILVCSGFTVFSIAIGIPVVTFLKTKMPITIGR